MQGTTRGIPEQVVTSLLAKPVVRPQEYASGQRPFLGRLGRQCLDRVKAAIAGTSYPKGAILFAQEGRPRGVYLVLEGSVQLSVSSPNGKSLILGFFGPGTVLGLESAILGWPHIGTAEITEPARLAFMERNDLLRHLAQTENAAFEAAEFASESCYFFLNRIKTVELSESAQEKLVRLLLELQPQVQSSIDQHTLRLHASQEAVARMIGTSRETVTRLLSRLKRKGILDCKRSTLIIRDLDALRKMNGRITLSKQRFH